MALSEGKVIYSTHGKDVILPAQRTNLELLAPCTHEEADTRLMVHALDSASNGYKRLKIGSNDTDVVVLAIAIANTLPADQVWVTYGTGKNVHPAHTVATSLGQKASVLLMFHALTGCDTVSFFGGRLKKTAWDTSNLLEVNQARKELFPKRFVT